MLKIAALPLLALPLFAPFGAPAGFEVRGAEVEVRRAGAEAEVRIVYDVDVKEAACGWFLAKIEGLPAGDAAPKAFLSIDGKEYPAVVESERGVPSVQAFRAERKDGVRLLSSKSIRVVLVYPKVACPGPEVSVALPVPVPAFVHDGMKEPSSVLPRVSVRFDAKDEETSAEVRAVFRAVPRGARLVLRSDALSAGATLVK